MSYLIPLVLIWLLFISMVKINQTIIFVVNIVLILFLIISRLRV